MLLSTLVSQLSNKQEASIINIWLFAMQYSDMAYINEILNRLFSKQHSYPNGYTERKNGTKFK